MRFPYSIENSKVRYSIFEIISDVGILSDAMGEAVSWLDRGIVYEGGEAYRVDDDGNLCNIDLLYKVYEENGETYKVYEDGETYKVGCCEDELLEDNTGRITIDIIPLVEAFFKKYNIPDAGSDMEVFENQLYFGGIPQNFALDIELYLFSLNNTDRELFSRRLSLRFNRLLCACEHRMGCDEITKGFSIGTDAGDKSNILVAGYILLWEIIEAVNEAYESFGLTPIAQRQPPKSPIQKSNDSTVWDEYIQCSNKEVGFDIIKKHITNKKGKELIIVIRALMKANILSNTSSRESLYRTIRTLVGCNITSQSNLNKYFYDDALKDDINKLSETITDEYNLAIK